MNLLRPLIALVTGVGIIELRGGETEFASQFLAIGLMSIISRPFAFRSTTTRANSVHRLGR